MLHKRCCFASSATLASECHADGIRMVLDAAENCRLQVGVGTAAAKMAYSKCIEVVWKMCVFERGEEGGVGQSN